MGEGRIDRRPCLGVPAVPVVSVVLAVPESPRPLRKNNLRRLRPCGILFPMSVFKKSFCALAALLLALPTLAIPVSLRFCRIEPLENEYGLISTPFTYTDGSQLLPGESFACVVVGIPSDAVSSLPSDRPPFSVAADGTVSSIVEGGVVAWANIGQDNDETPHSVVIDADGLPKGDWSGTQFQYKHVLCYCPSGIKDGLENGSLAYAILYAVVFDTRTVDAETGEVAISAASATAQSGPARIAKWGAITCFAFTKENVGAGTTPGPSAVVAFNVDAEIQESVKVLMGTSVTFVELGGPTTFDIAPIASVVVNGETVTEPAEVEAALRPGVSSLAQNAATESFPNGSLSLGLTPPAAPGLTAYELWTATKLDGTWQPFATVAKEKGLASDGEMRYSRLRIEKEESLEIPLFEGEPTRFYRLRALGSVTESGE